MEKPMLKSKKVSMILKKMRKHEIKPIIINGVKYYRLTQNGIEGESPIVISNMELMIMKKPSKHIYSDTEYCYVCDGFSPCSYNNLHDRMSTWLEGELPTVEQIENILMKQELRSANDVAKEIHSLITRKLTGKE